jgi:hypothetical protein
MNKSEVKKLRAHLVELALEWQKRFGVAPAITSALSEFDAATKLVGMTARQYGIDSEHRTAVSRGHDFIHNGVRYQVKANRPSGKPGSKARIINAPKTHDWDKLIWILYDTNYNMEEAWQWTVAKYCKRFQSPQERLRPVQMREGKCLFRSKRAAST